MGEQALLCKRVRDCLLTLQNLYFTSNAASTQPIMLLTLGNAIRCEELPYISKLKLVSQRACQQACGHIPCNSAAAPTCISA